jgi:hypothetical protein
MDIIGLAGLVVGLIALALAVYGIRDVREQVRTLVTLEQNRTWARVLRESTFRFVELTEEAREAKGSDGMHEFTMLVRALEPKKTLEEVLAWANKESVAHAKDMVALGLATYKPNMDERVIEEMAANWQNEKRGKMLESIFPKPKPWWRFGE